MKTSEKVKLFLCFFLAPWPSWRTKHSTEDCSNPPLLCNHHIHLLHLACAVMWPVKSEDLLIRSPLLVRFSFADETLLMLLTFQGFTSKLCELWLCWVHCLMEQFRVFVNMYIMHKTFCKWPVQQCRLRYIVFDHVLSCSFTVSCESDPMFPK